MFDITTYIKATKRFFRLRNAIFSIAIFFAISLYYFFYQNSAHTENFISLFSEKSYNFYSGSPGGFYIMIGDYLQKRSIEKSGINIISNRTAGSLDNWNRVITHPNSFALVNHGGITGSDYKKLIEDFRRITDDFKIDLHRLFHQGIKNDEPIEAELLHNYFDAGFLKNMDYEELLKMRRSKIELVTNILQKSSPAIVE